MKPVYLINISDRSQLRHGGDRPPLGLLYLASWLEKKNIPVKVIDGNHYSLGKTLDEIVSIVPKYIGIGFTTPQFNRAKELSITLRRLTKAKSKIIVGGPHPSVDPKSCSYFADYVIVGEGEKILEDIVKRKIKNEDNKSIFCIGQSIKNLDDLPLPARHLINMNKYNMRINGERTGTMMTSRGCPYNCSFCSKVDSKYRTHSPKRVYSELVILSKKYGYDFIDFQDDIFTLNKSRAREIAKLIKPLKIKYRIETRADCLDYDLLKDLKESGLKVLCLGIEHADNSVLKKNNKKMTVKQNLDIIKMAHQLDIKIKGYFIINLPGATEYSAIETLKFAQKHCDDADFYNLVAMPGSDIWRNPKKYGMKILDRSYNYWEASKRAKCNIDSIEFPKTKVLNTLKYIKDKYKGGKHDKNTSLAS
jgi:radical SAM superfamily enzyme YgiQ (UPF0313 family)